jgi:hypothetical protein
MLRTPRILGLAAAAIAVSMAAFTAHPGSTADPSTPTVAPPHSLLASDLPAVLAVPFDDDCQVCNQDCGGPFMHATDTQPEGQWVAIGSHPAEHDCVGPNASGDCSWDHEKSCGVAFLDSPARPARTLGAPAFLDHLMKAVPTDFAALVTSNPERVRYNVGRRAVQIFGCGGRLIAHIPLTPAFEAALLAEPEDR